MNNKYSEFYTKITSIVHNERERKRLDLWNHVCTYLFYVAYPALLIDRFFMQREIFAKLLFIPAISLLILSVVRAKLNFPRPYEAEDIVPLIPKNTNGKSMPSRHIFSATIIAMAYLYVMPWLGIILLIVAIVNGCIRVIGGVHYPKDVFVGFLCGVVCGLLFYWI